MTMLKTLLVFFAIVNSAMAADYTVGAPNGGWDQTTDLATWASSITFSTGDNLLFRYTANHDVAEVSQADFDSCNTNNPLQPPFTGGSTTITLSSAGRRYFICTVSGHCLGGMKVEIDTLSASAPPPTATPLAPSPPPANRLPVSSPSPPPRVAASGPTPPPSSTAHSAPSPLHANGRPVSSPSASPRAAASGPAPSPASTSPSALSEPPTGSHPGSSPSPHSAVSGPTPPPVNTTPPPSGSPSRRAAAPSSAAKFNVMGGLTAACSVFSVIMLLN